MKPFIRGTSLSLEGEKLSCLSLGGQASLGGTPFIRGQASLHEGGKPFIHWGGGGGAYRFLVAWFLESKALGQLIYAPLLKL